MGWNVLALFVSGVTADEAVAEVGPAEHTGRTVEADEATAGRVDDLVYAAESLVRENTSATKHVPNKAVF